MTTLFVHEYTFTCDKNFYKSKLIYLLRTFLHILLVVKYVTYIYLGITEFNFLLYYKLNMCLISKNMVHN